MDEDLRSLQRSYAFKIGKRYLSLERRNDPIIQRCTMYDYLRLEGVVPDLITVVIAKLEEKYRGILA